MEYQITKNAELPIVVKSVGLGFRLRSFKHLQQYNIKQVIFTHSAAAFSVEVYGKEKNLPEKAVMRIK